jgi:hypothetical protein
VSAWLGGVSASPRGLASLLNLSMACLTVPLYPVKISTPAAASVSAAFGPHRPVKTTDTPRSISMRAA